MTRIDEMNKLIEIADILMLDPGDKYSTEEKIIFATDANWPKTPIEILRLDIPVEDRFWIVLTLLLRGSNRDEMNKLIEIADILMLDPGDKYSTEAKIISETDADWPKTPIEILRLDIPAEDRLWVVLTLLLRCSNDR